MIKNEFSNHFYDIYNTMSEFIVNGKYTHHIHNKISICKNNNLKIFFNILNLNTNIDLCVNEYIFGKSTGKKIINSPLIFTLKNDFYYKLFFYDIDSIYDLLLCKNDFIIKPLYCKILNKKHIMMFVLDKKNKIYFILDINFSHFIMKYINDIVCTTMDDYNKKYNDNFTYTYIKNDNLKSLNKFKILYTDGLCVPISLLIIHYLIITKFSIDEIINNFILLTHNELLFLIKGYSLFYYLCCHSF